MKKSAVLFICSFALINGHLVAQEVGAFSSYEDYTVAYRVAEQPEQFMLPPEAWRQQYYACRKRNERAAEAQKAAALEKIKQDQEKKAQETSKIEQKSAPLTQPQGQKTGALGSTGKELVKVKETPRAVVAQDPTDSQTKIQRIRTVDRQKKSAPKQSWIEYTRPAAWL